MSTKKSILYLRQSAGRGGGADSIIINYLGCMDSTKFNFVIAYLRKYEEDLSPIINELTKRNITYFDFPGYKFIDLKQFINIIRLIKKYNVEIIHCHDSKSDFYGYILKFIFPQLKFVSTIHGWIFTRTRSIFYNKIDKFILRKSICSVIAVSKKIEQIAREQGIQNTYLIQNSIDIKEFQPKKHDIRFYDTRNIFNIGFIGRISKEKEPLDFVYTARKVLDKDTDCRFYVAGEGPEEDIMKSLVKQLRMENKFCFLGLLDNKNIIKLYQNLNLLILTSNTEGLPMVILEALAMMVPVVATNVGGVSEVIKHNYNGMLVDCGDIAMLSQMALIIKQQKGLAEKIGRNGREFITREFSLSEQVSKLEKIYERLR